MPRTSYPKIEKFYGMAWRWVLLVNIALVLFSEVTNEAFMLPPLIVTYLTYTFIGKYLPYKTLSWRIASGILVLIVMGAYYLGAFGGFDKAALTVGIIAWLLLLVRSMKSEFRSYWLSIFLSIAMTVAILLTDGNMFIYLIVIFYLGCFLFNLNAANLYFLASGKKEQNEELPYGYFRQFFYIIPIGLAAGALIFFIFPRASQIDISWDFGLGKAKVGYTGRVSLVGGGELNETADLAFIAKFNDNEWIEENYDSLLFRGKTLEYFDGKTWNTSLKASDVYSEKQELKTNKGYYNTIISMQIFREPGFDPTIFYPGVLVKARIHPSRKVGQILFGRTGDLQVEYLKPDKYSYLLDFHPRKIMLRNLKESLPKYKKEIASWQDSKYPLMHLAPDDLKKYLQMPSSVSSSEIFLTWKNDHKIDLKKTTVSKIIDIIKADFRKNFQVDLANQFDPANGFQQFLTQKKGHCEYFATAAAMLLRSLGIPSRIVTGYRGGTLNHVSELLEVQEQHAHAWLEFYYPSLGWLTLDPIPPTMIETSDRLSTFAAMYFNAVSFWFNYYVIDYDRAAQAQLIKSFWTQDNSSKKADKKTSWEWLKSYRRSFYLVSLLILLTSWLIIRRMQQIRIKYAVPNYYRRIVRKLITMGYVKYDGESLKQYHLRLIAAGFDREVINKIDRAIETDLYSQYHLTKAERAGVGRLAKRLKIITT